MSENHQEILTSCSSINKDNPVKDVINCLNSTVEINQLNMKTALTQDKFGDHFGQTRPRSPSRQLISEKPTAVDKITSQENHDVNNQMDHELLSDKLVSVDSNLSSVSSNHSSSCSQNGSIVQMNNICEENTSELVEKTVEHGNSPNERLETEKPTTKISDTSVFPNQVYDVCTAESTPEKLAESTAFSADMDMPANCSEDGEVLAVPRSEAECSNGQEEGECEDKKSEKSNTESIEPSRTPEAMDAETPVVEEVSMETASALLPTCSSKESEIPSVSDLHAESGVATAEIESVHETDSQIIKETLCFNNDEASRQGNTSENCCDVMLVEHETEAEKESEENDYQSILLQETGEEENLLKEQQSNLEEMDVSMTEVKEDVEDIEFRTTSNSSTDDHMPDDASLIQIPGAEASRSLEWSHEQDQVEHQETCENKSDDMELKILDVSTCREAATVEYNHVGAEYKDLQADENSPSIPNDETTTPSLSDQGCADISKDLEEELLAGDDGDEGALIMDIGADEESLLDNKDQSCDAGTDVTADEQEQRVDVDAKETEKAEAEPLSIPDDEPATMSKDNDEEDDDDDEGDDEDDDISDGIDTEMVDDENNANLHDSVDLIQDVDIEMIEDPDIIQPADSNRKIFKAVISSSTDEHTLNLSQKAIQSLQESVTIDADEESSSSKNFQTQVSESVDDEADASPLQSQTSLDIEEENNSTKLDIENHQVLSDNSEQTIIDQTSNAHQEQKDIDIRPEPKEEADTPVNIVQWILHQLIAGVCESHDESLMDTGTETCSKSELVEDENLEMKPLPDTETEQSVVGVNEAVPLPSQEICMKPELAQPTLQDDGSSTVTEKKLSPVLSGQKRSIEDDDEDSEPRKKSRLDDLVTALHQRTKEIVADDDKLEESESEESDDQPLIYVTAKELEDLISKRMQKYVDEVKHKLEEGQRQLAVWKAMAKDLQERAYEQSSKVRKARLRNVGVQVDNAAIAKALAAAAGKKKANAVTANKVAAPAVPLPSPAVPAVNVTTTSAVAVARSVLSGAIAAAVTTRSVPIPSAISTPAPRPSARVAPSNMVNLPAVNTKPSPRATAPARLSNPHKQKDDVVDLTCDDDISVVSSQPPDRRRSNTTLKPMAAPDGGILIVRQDGQNLVPVVPPPQLPKNLDPGTYLLSQTGSGAVLQPIVSTNNAASKISAQPPSPRGGRGGGRGSRGSRGGRLPTPRTQTPRQQAAIPQGPVQRASQTSRKSTALPAGGRRQISNGNRDRSTSPDVVITTISKQTHPAPPPSLPPNPRAQLGWREGPTKPVLKITSSPTGIVLSWTHPYDTNIHAEVVKYQIYAYQESPGPVTSALWKKVGNVNALPLPMACTLTQFQSGNQYYFILCGVDNYNRAGPFSDAGFIKPSGH